MPQNQSVPLNQPNIAQQPSREDKIHVAEELVHAIGESQDVLVRAKTVFPFTIFPDTVTLDRSKLTITTREFAKVGEAMSVRIEDILNVTANVGPFLGSLTVTTRFFNPDKPYTVHYLSRKDALRLKRIIQGYLIAKQREIDCNVLSTQELASLLDELGKVAPEEKV